MIKKAALYGILFLVISVLLSCGAPKADSGEARETGAYKLNYETPILDGSDEPVYVLKYDTKKQKQDNVTLETLKSYLGMKRSEIPYELSSVKHGNYYDTVKQNFRMYGYGGKLSFVFKENMVTEACWESGEIQRNDVNVIIQDYKETTMQYEGYYKGANCWILTSDHEEYYEYYNIPPEHDPPFTFIIGVKQPTGSIHYNEYGNPDWFKTFPYWKHSSGKYVCCVTGSTGSDLTFDFSDGVYLNGTYCYYNIEPDSIIEYRYKKGWSVKYDSKSGILMSICDPSLTQSRNQGYYYPISKQEYNELRAR